jgi:hypothetical protein
MGNNCARPLIQSEGIKRRLNYLHENDPKLFEFLQKCLTKFIVVTTPKPETTILQTRMYMTITQSNSSLSRQGNVSHLFDGL